MSFRWMVMAAFVVSLAFALPQSRLAQAQTSTGAITGVVTDASGGVVANAEAKATNETTGRVWTVASGPSGEFQLQNLPPGSYAVEVSAAGFQVFRANKIGVSVGSTSNLPVRLVVESARKVIIVNGEVAGDYKPTAMAIGNLSSQPLQELPISGLVVTRSLLDDQQARLLSDVAKNDTSVGEDYAPVGWYQDFEIRGFPLDLASGIKINGLSAAGQQLIALENKDAVEFLHGVDADEVGVASGGGLVNYVTKRPAGVRTLNLAGEDIRSYVHGADGTREFGAVAADWKITSNTFLKGDFEYQHLVQRSVGGYQLLGGTTVPVDVSPDVMLGYQWWAKPNTFDAFSTSLRLDHNLSKSWRFFVSAGRSRSLIDDNIAWPYGCYYAASCAKNNTPYFFSPTGDYDVYDWRSPGELYI